MKHKGTELKEFTSDKPVVFDPPRKMLVWDSTFEAPRMWEVAAYLPAVPNPVVAAHVRFAHCAELPEELKPRRATNRELARWLVRGNGEVAKPDDGTIYAYTAYFYAASLSECAVLEGLRVRKWDDFEWHEPTADYMGLEG